MRDLASNIAVRAVIAPVVVSDNTAAVGTVIDRLGFNSLAYVIAPAPLPMPTPPSRFSLRKAMPPAPAFLPSPMPT